MQENKNGITLIALVITIVILIILAVVAIGAVFGEGGLIDRANYGKKESEKADAREQLELVLADAYVEKNINEEYNQDEFLDDFIYERKPEAEVMEEEISLNGYTFELDRSVPRLGDYIGEAGNLPATIRKINVTNKTLSEVSVEVITARAEGATYRYSYKKEAEEDTEYKQVAEKEENTNTYSGLESQVVYNLKVELIKDNQVIDEEVVNVMLGKIEEGSLTFGKESWSNGTASLPVSTTTNMQIQYQINGIEEGSWTGIENNGSIPNIANGSDVYARLWDGTNGSEYISRRIEDMTPPTVEISTSNLTSSSVTLTVTASDNESGLATSGTYKYYLNSESSPRETSTTNSYNYTGLTAGTQYTLKVIVTDKAGKATEKSTIITTTKAEIADIVGGSDLDKTTEVEDDEGNKIWIPGGFNVTEDSATTEDEGIVIEDSKGNQFVWVPVKDYTTMYEEKTATLLRVTTQTTVYSKLRQRSGDSYTITTPGNNPSGIREPDVLSSYDTSSSYYSILGCSSTKDMADKMVAEYKATYESIKKYKGFYIGRYELTGSVASPTVKKGQTVLADKNWYNLKKACTNIVSTSYAQTTMIYGNQWDEVMSWLKTTEFASDPSKVDSDSSSWGNYSNSTGEAATGSGTKRPSGYNEAWQANNIYDLAGNCQEWTQEANNTSDRVNRGGYYNYYGSRRPASGRSNNGPTAYSSISYLSSRSALYIK